MKKPDFTPQQWYISDIPQEDGFYLYSKNNLFSAIARVYKQDRRRAEQDAKLIASAPDLAEALNEALNEALEVATTNFVLRNKPLPLWYYKAYEALKKAGYTDK